MLIQSKANTVNLTTVPCANHPGLYDFGLGQVAERLTRVVQEQRDAEGFDWKLAERTFVDADYMLRLIREA
jgi:hypothetical protein